MYKLGMVYEKTENSSDKTLFIGAATYLHFLQNWAALWRQSHRIVVK